MTDPATVLDSCDTLMLDMDGTLLDLAFDNYIWLEVVPFEFARRHDLSVNESRRLLRARMRSLQGRLDWYCLDYWSELLDLDIVGLHRAANHRIVYLPGARQFLEQVAAHGVRLLLVTNSHRGTLDLKTEATGVADFFDQVYTSHDLGHPKEDQLFWQLLQEAEDFDPARTLFVDDNTSVLASARKFGFTNLLAVSKPASDRPGREISEFAAVAGVADIAVGSGARPG